MSDVPDSVEALYGPDSSDPDGEDYMTDVPDQVEALAKVWKAHHPVGAYLPVGQLDGDCSCGRGEWTPEHHSTAALAWVREQLDNNEQAIYEAVKDPRYRDEGYIESTLAAVRAHFGDSDA